MPVRPRRSGWYSPVCRWFNYRSSTARMLSRESLYVSKLEAPLLTHSARRRLVLVVRADPVICGHAGEARNLAEAALTHGFDDVRIVSWPLDRLVESGLPLKPFDSISPYSEGITVERPE